MKTPIDPPPPCLGGLEKYPDVLETLRKHAGAGTRTDQDRAIADAINSADGRKKLAAAMRSDGRNHVLCPVCGGLTRDLARHAESAGDDVHRVMEVMES